MSVEGKIATCAHCGATEVVPNLNEHLHWWCSIWCYEHWMEEDPYERG